MRNRTNTITSSFSEFSKRSSLLIHFSGIIARTNGAPSLCTIAKMKALEITAPTITTRAPIHGPYIMPAAICTISPGMNATTICRNWKASKMNTPPTPALRTSSTTRCKPSGSDSSAIHGAISTHTPAISTKNNPKPTNLKISALVRRAREGRSETGTSYFSLKASFFASYFSRCSSRFS